MTTRPSANYEAIRSARNSQPPPLTAEASRKRLFTAGIGTLSRFEQYFGHLWGHGLQADQLTENQKQWRGVWEACRADALTHINNQLRALGN